MNLGEGGDKIFGATHTRAIILYSYITEQMNSGEGGDKIFGAYTHKGNNIVLLQFIEQMNLGEGGDKIFEATTHKGFNLVLLHYRTVEPGGRG